MPVNHTMLHFTKLDRTDIDSILVRNNVGRLAFAWAGRVDIRPLHYVYSRGAIYGRTAPDTSFVQTDELPSEVAFEVDEIESVTQWKSVIARGIFEIVPADDEEWTRAAELLRRVMKSTFTGDDPVPQRSVIFRIRVLEATGRASD